MQQQGNNLIGLTFFLVNGHFITVPTTVEMADKVMEEWAAGKYRDRNCEKCNGKGGHIKNAPTDRFPKPASLATATARRCSSSRAPARSAASRNGSSRWATSR